MSTHPAGKKSTRKLLQQRKGQLQERFLEAYAKCANVQLAADQVGVNRSKHYDWLQDPEYEAKFSRAFEEAAERIDGEIHRRGVIGVLKPVFYKGQKCGSIREYSDTLLIFFAKGMMPDKYATFRGEIETKNQLMRSVDFAELTDEQLAILQNWSRAAVGGGSETLAQLVEPDAGGSGDRA